MAGNPPEDRANERPAFNSDDAELLKWWYKQYQSGETYEMQGRKYPSRYSGPREAEGLNRYGMSPTRVAQRVNHLIDHPDAPGFNDGEVAPIVNSLQRMRDQAAEKRSARRLK